MDRGGWQATVHGVARVGHDLATKPPPPPPEILSHELPYSRFLIWIYYLHSPPYYMRVSFALYFWQYLVMSFFWFVFNSGTLKYYFHTIDSTFLRCIIIWIQTNAYSIIVTTKNQDTEDFQKISLCPFVLNPLLSPLGAGNHWADFCPYSFTFPRMS